MRLFETELEAEGLVSLADFDVLAQLARAPERRLRMSELADVIVLSRSGMTRRIDRLQAAGLVRRDECVADRRGAFAALTEAGLAALDRTRPTHVRGVEQHFISRLTADELDALRSTLSKLLPGGDTTRLDGAECRGDD
jgi:DNA-binding MarR family transcriptional regulator